MDGDKSKISTEHLKLRISLCVVIWKLAGGTEKSTTNLRYPAKLNKEIILRQQLRTFL